MPCRLAVFLFEHQDYGCLSVFLALHVVCFCISKKCLFLNWNIVALQMVLVSAVHQSESVRHYILSFLDFLPI